MPVFEESRVHPGGSPFQETFAAEAVFEDIRHIINWHNGTPFGARLTTESNRDGPSIGKLAAKFLLEFVLEPRLGRLYIFVKDYKTAANEIFTVFCQEHGAEATIAVLAHRRALSLNFLLNFVPTADTALWRQPSEKKTVPVAAFNRLAVPEQDLSNLGKDKNPIASLHTVCLDFISNERCGLAHEIQASMGASIVMGQPALECIAAHLPTQPGSLSTQLSSLRSALKPVELIAVLLAFLYPRARQVLAKADIDGKPLSGYNMSLMAAMPHLIAHLASQQ